MKTSNTNILYLGIDVDDKFFHVAGYEPATDEKIEFKVKAAKTKLAKKLKKLRKEGKELKVCYEATYVGFDLYRALEKEKIHCDVIVPTLIPQVTGRKQKTDKLDSRKLALYYSKGLLEKVDVPTKEEENDRTVVRTRNFLIRQRKKIKQYILSECRLHGINYKEETDGKCYWTKTHIEWMHNKISKLEETLKISMEALMFELNMMDKVIEEIEDRIEILSKTEKYREKVQGLKTFRGIDTLTAMTLLTEIRDVKRFSHPKYLVSYAGMDITEYSSGGKSRRFGISKMGNTRLRKALVESCQSLNNYRLTSKRLERERKNTDKEIVNVAEKCGKRLMKKATKMRIAGKHNNKIKVACAREMLCFVWEALQKIERH
jgi:transposase